MPKVELADYPHDWPDAGDNLMSNFDGEVDQKIAARMKVEHVTANYPGWNFNAQCWFEGGKFKAAVRCYSAHVATYAADTPEELRDEISAEYGSE